MPLKIAIDFDQFGLGELTRIGYLDIENDGTGDRNVGNYKYKVSGGRKKVLKGHVREDGAWELVRKILEKERVLAQRRRKRLHARRSQKDVTFGS